MERDLKCMYCAEMGITNTDVFIEIVDVELGHGWICKECFIESEKEKENFLKAELQSIKEHNRTLEELEVFRVEELAKLDDLRVENTKLKKQLKHKEQECEELKEQLIKCDDNIIVDCEYSKKDLCSFIHRKKEVINGLQEQLDQLKAENDKLEKKIKEVKNVLSESFSLWMFHIANGVGNSSNANVQELLEDFAVAIRLLADTLGESEAFLSYKTNDSEVYKHRKDLLQKMNEVCNEKKL